MNAFEGEVIYSDIQVYKFISLFMQVFNVESEIVVASLIYVERLLKKNQHFKLTETNAKSVLHAALTLAAKFFLDKYEKHTIFYSLGNLSKK